MKSSFTSIVKTEISERKHMDKNRAFVRDCFIKSGVISNPSRTYLKEADEIADVLKIIRANKSLLALEEMRVEKAIANNVNRKVNFEAANLNKTVDAAQSQIEAIKFISQSVGLSVLSAPLEEVARMRLEHENLSLAEIGELSDPPIGKSGVNHRLRKICKIAENIKTGGNNDG
jgi:hypothetical protein